ncbi:MAG: sugar ABC transporter substrate-binding protein [Actinobacteria bacterium]|nr:sugar ABC transporter substrate-binding protein [Actinomycetota bacterium]
MSKHRKFALGLGATGLVALAVAVAGQARSAETYTIGWVPPTVAPFEAAMREGIQDQAKALGMKVIVAGGQFDPNVQITAVDSLVQRKVDAILIWPLDEKGIQPAFDRARAAGIPVIVIDSPGAKTATANFQTNDTTAGSALARSAAAAIAKSGRKCAVGIIQGIEVVPILRARNAGLEAGARAAGCTILDKQANTKDNVETARAIVTTWRTKFGEKMTGILAVNDPSALAALSAVRGSFKPVITGYNGDALNVEQIQKGTIFATAALLSPEIGNGMAWAAYQVITGKSVPRTVAVPYLQLDSGNIGSYQPYADRLKAAMKVSVAKRGSGYVLVTAPGA